MSKNLEIRKRAIALRNKFCEMGEFRQDDYCLALREALRPLGVTHEFSDAIAQQIDDEQCGVQTAEDLARMKLEIELLTPYWGPGVTKEQAVAAYFAANPDSPIPRPKGM